VYNISRNRKHLFSFFVIRLLLEVPMEDLNRQRVLEAAGELFNTRGYKAVTISDIAEKLGMSKKTIYQYFTGKEEIALSVIEEFMGRVAEKFDRLEPSSDPISDIRSLFEQIKSEVARISPLFQDDIRKFLPHVHQRLKEMRAEKFKKIEDCIRAAQHMGQVKETVDAHLTTIVLLEALEGFSRSEMSRHGISKFQAVDTLIDIFISGIINHSS
jgi:AcrR family transcriptional regulator